MEDKTIKRLLRLRSNPHFQLNPNELEMIRKWEEKQEQIEIKEVSILDAPEGFEYSESIGSESGPAIVPKKKKAKKTKNIVKKEEKETGEIKEG